MRTHLSIIAAAALAVGTMGVTTSFAQETGQPAQPTAGQRIEGAAEKTGDAVKDAANKTGEAIGLKRDVNAPSPNAEEIHDVLAQVAESALTKGGLDDMVERFVDADRNRLGQGDTLKQENAELDGRIAQLQQDWKAKYGQDFDIKDEDKVYGQAGFAMITEGETPGERAQPARERQPGEAAPAAPAPATETPGQTSADRNRDDAGRNIATVTIAESHGMPALTVPLIHEAGGWKIDIPDNVDAAKLRDNVQAALTKCGESKDKWAENVDDSYRAVTHKVLLSIFDKKLDDRAQPAAGQLPSDTSAQPAQPGLSR
jgi:hypothetical protein